MAQHASIQLFKEEDSTITCPITPEWLTLMRSVELAKYKQRLVADALAVATIIVATSAPRTGVTTSSLPRNSPPAQDLPSADRIPEGDYELGDN